jgi:hypothetical protein
MLALEPQTVLEEAQAMILQNILEAKKARLLEISLRTQSIEAHASGRADDALALQRVADDLAARFPSPDKIKLSSVP